MADASNSHAPKASSEPSPDDDDDQNAQRNGSDHHDSRGRDIESSSAPASINTSTLAEDSNAVESLKPMPMPRRPPRAHHPSEPVAELSESPSSLSSFSTASDTSFDDSDVSSSSDEDDMREATELHRVSSILRHRRSSRSTLRSGGASLVSQPTTATDSIASSEIRRYRLRRQRAPRWYDGAKRFWTRHISIVVPANDQRDHLALERTFLGYLRTSLILSMTGVMVAQLFRLQHSLAPDPTLGYFVLGIPLAATFICASIAVILIGALRCWRQQGAMARGKVIAGGFEIYVIMVGALVVCFVLLLCLVVPYTPD